MRVKEEEKNSRGGTTVQVGGWSKPTLNCKLVMLGLSPVGRGEPLKELVEKQHIVRFVPLIFPVPVGSPHLKVKGADGFNGISPSLI